MERIANAVSIKLAIKPWWMRLPKAVELLIFGTVWMEGQIRDVEGSDPSNG